ncbi:CBS domain-containing protein [Microbispora hainanensis]|jgi:CBS-domain-containing membrane protein|uniref:CBS domain-containing protein n=1 Tax=Microbispora hainanensis TaxID=568844 RepID=A0ABZ1SQW2_9ACTN|nr:MULTISPECIES: CBS domain-containing protein [Microbispora]NJP23822.1 CBS domain-containing protein [Microbispora sp. CL1-1]TQS15355.1 CBS domain-containing protein [Microbispora sp. SCL1-1]
MSVETMTASDVMTRTLVTVEPEESPLMAWELMWRAGVHHLPVVDACFRLVGVLGREDVAAHWSGGPAEQSRTAVRTLLQGRRCPRVAPDAPLPEVAALMADADCCAVPVLGPDDVLRGLVTTTDVLMALAGRTARPVGDPTYVKGGLFRLEPVPSAPRP